MLLLQIKSHQRRIKIPKSKQCRNHMKIYKKKKIEKEKKLMKNITMENMVDMDIKNQNKKDLGRKENVLILKIKFQSLLSRKYTL